MAAIGDLLARVRRPEHTGENRCLPCTAVNVALAGGVGLAVAARRTRSAGLSVFGGGLAAIYLRGYLVPGTPRLTAKYLPDRVLGLFGKADTGADVDVLDADDETTERLLRAGVLACDPNTDGLGPASEFAAAWRRRVGETAPSAAAVADALGAADVSRVGDRSFVVDGNSRLWWESETALVADLAAAAELRGRLDEWTALDASERADLLTAVRAVLGRCPRCGGQATVERRRTDHCCRPSEPVVSSSCADCGAPLVETALRDEPAWVEALPAE